MGRPRGKWPHYAEWARLDAIAALREIERLTREMQALIRDGRYVEAVIAAGDIREKATAARLLLVQAPNGETQEPTGEDSSAETRRSQ